MIYWHRFLSLGRECQVSPSWNTNYMCNLTRLQPAWLHLVTPSLFLSPSWMVVLTTTIWHSWQVFKLCCTRVSRGHVCWNAQITGMYEITLLSKVWNLTCNFSLLSCQLTCPPFPSMIALLTTTKSNFFSWVIAVGVLPKPYIALVAEC